MCTCIPVSSPLCSSLFPSASRSAKIHAQYVEKYGRNVRIRGLGPVGLFQTALRVQLTALYQWDERLLPLDPASVSHVLKNCNIYEKPWQSRRLIAGLIGCGMLAAEGHIHRRQRRVATPAFSIQNLRALVPLVFRKGNELRDKWSELFDRPLAREGGIEIDVCHWISRATFDVIGLAGEIFLFCTHRKVTDQQGSIITLMPSKMNRTSSFVRTRRCSRLLLHKTVDFEPYLGYTSPFSTSCS